MLNEQEMGALLPAPASAPRARHLQVVRAGSDAAADAPPAVRPSRGVPRTVAEWTALVKIGSGEKDIEPSECERLVAMRLVLTVGGVPTLTRHGRSTLGF